MKFIPRWFLAAALAAATLLPSHAASAGAASPDHLAILARFRADYAQSLVQGSPTIAADYFGAEMRLMPEFQKTVLGREHALEYYQALAGRYAVL